MSLKQSIKFEKGDRVSHFKHEIVLCRESNLAVLQI